MRPLRAGSLLLLTLLAASALAWIGYVAVHLALTGSLRLGSEAHEGAAPGVWIGGLLGLALIALLIGYALRRWVVRPLEALSRAAGRVAAGELDDAGRELPAARVREIARVRDAFGRMIAGLRASDERRALLEEERRFFIGAIAHDLRTPLFALRGCLEGLDRGIAASPERMKKYVAVCMEKSAQLDRLVSDLFVFAKTDYMEQTQRAERVDVAAALRRSVDSLRPAAEATGVALTVETPEAGACLEAGDAHLLERALLNLLDNALRHTPAGGTIRAGCREEGGWLLVAVSDTGPGFELADLARVFEPLYRSEASRSRETGGAGLGLPIARRVFRAHGGELTAANGPAGGAVLAGRLPIAGGCLPPE